ncbi:hypothetical protein Tco_1270050 [Tanacetum coccineum]
MDNTTRDITDNNQSNDQEVETEETHNHDVIESDDQGHSACLPQVFPKAYVIRDAGILDHMKKQSEKQKVIERFVFAAFCQQPGHNSRTCPMKKNKGNEITVDAFQAEE